MRLSTGLFLSLLIATPALAEDAPPRLSTLAPALSADHSQERTITQLGPYAQTRITQLQLKAGAEIPAHGTPSRALVIVLSGSGHFDFNGEMVPLHERQVLHMAPGEPHAVKAETDLELLVVRLPTQE